MPGIHIRMVGKKHSALTVPGSYWLCHKKNVYKFTFKWQRAVRIVKQFPYEKELMKVIRRIMKCQPNQGQQFSTQHLMITYNHTFWTRQDKMFAMLKFRDRLDATAFPQAFILTINILHTRESMVNNRECISPTGSESSCTVLYTKVSLGRESLVKEDCQNKSKIDAKYIENPLSTETTGVTRKSQEYNDDSKLESEIFADKNKELKLNSKIVSRIVRMTNEDRQLAGMEDFNDSSRQCDRNSQSETGTSPNLNEDSVQEANPPVHTCGTIVGNQGLAETSESPNDFHLNDEEFLIRESCRLKKTKMTSKDLPINPVTTFHNLQRRNEGLQCELGITISKSEMLYKESLGIGLNETFDKLQATNKSSGCSQVGPAMFDDIIDTTDENSIRTVLYKTKDKICEKIRGLQLKQGNKIAVHSGKMFIIVENPLEMGRNDTANKFEGCGDPGGSQQYFRTNLSLLCDKPGIGKHQTSVSQHKENSTLARQNSSFEENCEEIEEQRCSKQYSGEDKNTCLKRRRTVSVGSVSKSINCNDEMPLLERFVLHGRDPSYEKVCLNKGNKRQSISDNEKEDTTGKNYSTNQLADQEDNSFESFRHCVMVCGSHITEVESNPEKRDAIADGGKERMNETEDVGQQCIHKLDDIAAGDSMDLPYQYLIEKEIEDSRNETLRPDRNKAHAGHEFADRVVEAMKSMDMQFDTRNNLAQVINDQIILAPSTAKRSINIFTKPPRLTLDEESGIGNNHCNERITTGDNDIQHNTMQKYLNNNINQPCRNELTTMKFVNPNFEIYETSSKNVGKIKVEDREKIVVRQNNKLSTKESVIIGNVSVNAERPKERFSEEVCSGVYESSTEYDQEDDDLEDFELKIDREEMTPHSSNITDLVMEGLMFTIIQDEDNVKVLEQRTKLEMDEVLENSEKAETKEGEECLVNSSLLRLENLITKIEAPIVDEQKIAGIEAFKTNSISAMSDTNGDVKDMSSSKSGNRVEELSLESNGYVKSDEDIKEKVIGRCGIKFLPRQTSGLLLGKQIDELELKSLNTVLPNENPMSEYQWAVMDNIKSTLPKIFPRKNTVIQNTENINNVRSGLRSSSLKARMIEGKELQSDMGEEETNVYMNIGSNNLKSIDILQSNKNVPLNAGNDLELFSRISGNRTVWPTRQVNARRSRILIKTEYEQGSIIGKSGSKSVQDDSVDCINSSNQRSIVAEPASKMAALLKSRRVTRLSTKTQQIPLDSYSNEVQEPNASDGHLNTIMLNKTVGTPWKLRSTIKKYSMPKRLSKVTVSKAAEEEEDIVPEALQWEFSAPMHKGDKIKITNKLGSEIFRKQILRTSKGLLIDPNTEKLRDQYAPIQSQLNKGISSAGEKIMCKWNLRSKKIFSEYNFLMNDDEMGEAANETQLESLVTNEPRNKFSDPESTTNLRNEVVIENSSNTLKVVSNTVITHDQIPLGLKEPLREKFTRYGTIRKHCNEISGNCFHSRSRSEESIYGSVTFQQSRRENPDRENTSSRKAMNSFSDTTDDCVGAKRSRAINLDHASQQTVNNYLISEKSSRRRTILKNVPKAPRKRLGREVSPLREIQDLDPQVLTDVIMEKMFPSTDGLVTIEAREFNLPHDKEDVTQDFHVDLIKQKRRRFVLEQKNLRQRKRISEVRRKKNAGELHVEMWKLMQDITQGAKVVLQRISEDEIRNATHASTISRVPLSSRRLKNA